MFFIDNKKFDILYKDIFAKEYSLEELKSNKLNYVLNNTTFEPNEINEELVDELFDFIYSKTNFKSKETFTSTVNETTTLLNDELFKFIIEILLGLNYKIKDFVMLNKKQLIQTFILELSYNKDKINKDIFIEKFTNLYDSDFAEEICNALGITESQKAKEKEEQLELINQLRDL